MISNRGHLLLNICLNFAFAACICFSYLLDFFSFLGFRISLDTVNYNIQLYDVKGWAYTGFLEFEEFACGVSRDESVLTVCSNLYNFKTAGALYVSLSIVALFVIAANIVSLCSRLFARSHWLNKLHKSHYSSPVVYIFASSAYIWVSNFDNLVPPKDVKLDMSIDFGIKMLFIASSVGIIAFLHYVYITQIRRIDDIDLGFVLFENIEKTQANDSQLNFYKEREKDYLILLNDMRYLKEFLMSEVPVKVNPQHFLSKEVFNMLCNFWVRRGSEPKFTSPDSRLFSTGAPSTSVKAEDWEEVVVVNQREAQGTEIADEVNKLKSDHDAELARLNAENADLKRQVEAFRSQAKAAKEDSVRLMKLNHDNDEEFGRLRANAEKTHLQAMQGRNMKITDLEAHLAEAALKKQSIEYVFADEKAGLEEVLLRYSVKIEKLEAKLLNSIRENETLANTYRSTKTSLKESLRRYCFKIEDLEAHLAESSLRREALEQTVLEVQEILGAKVARLKRNAKVAENEHSDLVHDMNELIEHLKLAVINDNDRDKSTLQIEIRLLQDKAASRERECAEHRAELEQLRELLDNADSLLEEKRAKARQVRVEIVELHYLIGTLQERSERSDMAREDLKALILDLELKLKEAVNAMNAQADELTCKAAFTEDSLRLTIDRLMVKLAEAEGELEARTLAISDEQQSYGSLSLKLRFLEERYSIKLNKIKLYRLKRNMLADLLEQSEMETQDYASKLYELQYKHAEQKQQLDLKTSELQTAKTLLEEMHVKHKAEQTRLMRVQMASADLYESHLTLDRSYSTAVEDVERLRGEVEDLESNLRRAEDTIAELVKVEAKVSLLAERRGMTIEEYEDSIAKLEYGNVDKQDQILEYEGKLERQAVLIKTLQTDNRYQAESLTKLRSVFQRSLMIVADLESHDLSSAQSDEMQLESLQRELTYFRGRNSELKQELATLNKKQVQSQQHFAMQAEDLEGTRLAYVTARAQLERQLGLSLFSAADTEALLMRLSERLAQAEANCIGLKTELQTTKALEMKKDQQLQGSRMSHEDLAERLGQREQALMRLGLIHEDTLTELDYKIDAYAVLKREVSSLTFGIKGLKVTNGKLNAKTQHQKSVIDAQATSLEDLTASLAQLSLEKEGLQRLIEDLLLKLTRSGLSAEDLAAIILRLDSALVTSNQQRAELQRSLDAAFIEIELLRQQLASAEVVVINHKATAEEATYSDQLSLKLEWLKMQAEDALAAFTRKDSDSNTLIIELNLQLSLLTSQYRLREQEQDLKLTQKAEALSIAAAQIEDTEALLATLSLDSATSAAQCRDLVETNEKLLTDNLELQSSLAEKTEEVAKLEDSVATLSRRIIELVDKIAKLKRSLSHVGMHRADLESAFDRLNELKEGLEVQLLLIQGKLELLHRRGQGKDELEHLVAELEGKINELEATIKELTEKNRGLQRQTDVLEEDNTNLYEKVSELEAAEAFNLLLATRLGMEREDLEAKLAHKTVVTRRMADEISSLNIQLEGLESQIETYKAQLSDAEAKCTKAQKHALAMEGRVDRLQGEVTELVRQRDEFKQKISQLETEKATLLDSLKEAELKLAELEATIKALKCEADRLETEWSRTLMVVEDLAAALQHNTLTRADLGADLALKLRIIFDLESLVSIQKAKISTLAIELEDLRKERADLQKSRAELDRLKTTHNELKARFSESEMLRNSIASTATELRSQYDDLLSERSRGPEEIIIECRGSGLLTPFVTPQKVKKAKSAQDTGLDLLFEELEQARMMYEDLLQAFLKLTDQKATSEAKLTLQITDARSEADSLGDRLKNTLERVKVLEQGEVVLKNKAEELETEKEKYKKGCYSRQLMYKKAAEELVALKKTMEELAHLHSRHCELLQEDAALEQGKLRMTIQDLLGQYEIKLIQADSREKLVLRLQKEVSKRGAILKRLEEELKELKQKTTTQGKTDADYQAATKRIKELEVELTAQRALVQSLLKQIAELEDKYQDKLGKAEGESAQLAEQLEEETVKAGAYADQLYFLEVNHAGEFERLRMARQELRHLIESYEASIKDYEARLLHLSKQLKEVSGQTLLSQKRIDDLSIEKKIVEDLLVERDRQLKTLQNDMQGMDYEFVRDKADLMQKYADIKARYELFAEQNAALDERRQTLEDTLEQLQEKLALQKAELLAKEQTLTKLTTSSSELQRAGRDKDSELGILRSRLREASDLNSQLMNDKEDMQEIIEELEAEANQLRAELMERADMSQQLAQLEEETDLIRGEAAERNQELLLCKTKLQSVRRELAKRKKAYLVRMLVHIYKQSYNIKLAFGYFKLLWTQPDVAVAMSSDFRNFENLQADELTDPEMEEGEKVLTRAKTALLTENPVRLTFENAGLNESPLAYANVFKFFEELMDKKYEIDQADIAARREPRSMAEFMLEHLNRRFGLKKLEIRYLCQLMPALQLLYREEQPYGTLFCRLLQVYHYDPVPFELAVILTRVRVEFVKLMERTSKGRDDRDSKRGQKQISKKHQSMLAYEMQACGGEVFLADLLELVYHWFASDSECGEMFIELLKPSNISQADFVTFLICQRMVTMGKDPSSIFDLLAQDSSELTLDRFISGLRSSLDLWVSVDSISLVFDLIDTDASADVTKEEFSLKIGFDQYYFRARSDDYVVTKCCFLNAFVEAYRVLQTQQAARLLRVFYEFSSGTMNLTQFRKVLQIVDANLTISSIDHLYNKGISMSLTPQEGLDRDGFCGVLLKYSIGFKNGFSVLNLESATRRRKQLAPDIKITTEGRILSPPKKASVTRSSEFKSLRLSAEGPEKSLTPRQ